MSVAPAGLGHVGALGWGMNQQKHIAAKPLQNRVTPFGEIVAIPQRGLFTGNRGILHDPATKTLLKRRWNSKAWLICLCDFKGMHREVMGTGWTELFFLDEAVALSAGHRPCFFCRRVDAGRFQAAWADAAAMPKPSAPQIDTVLHAERQLDGAKRIHPLSMPAAALPDGCVVVRDGAAFTLNAGRGFRWTEAGYGPGEPIGAPDGLLTPPSTVATLRAGYRPILHPSISREAPG